MRNMTIVGFLKTLIIIGVVMSVFQGQTQTQPKVEQKNPAGQVQKQDSERISINEADAETLVKLPRIGPVLAQRIIEYRQANNGFKTLEELKEVRGIGEKTFAGFEGLIRL